jgi:chorismate mutase
VRTLADVRAEIDRVDGVIIESTKRRLELMREAKALRGPGRDDLRERAILSRVDAAGLPNFVRTLYERFFVESETL